MTTTEARRLRRLARYKAWLTEQDTYQEDRYPYAPWMASFTERIDTELAQYARKATAELNPLLRESIDRYLECIQTSAVWQTKSLESLTLVRPEFHKVRELAYKLLYLGNLKGITDGQRILQAKGWEPGKQEFAPLVASESARTILLTQGDLFATLGTVPAPEQALAWFQPLQAVTRDVYDQQQLWGQAFTMAYLQESAVVSQVQSHVAEALQNGWTYQEFRESLVTDTRFWNAYHPEQGRNWNHHWETVYRTNLNASYNQGRVSFFNDPELKGYVKAYQYNAILDDRVRPAHAKMNGRVYAKNHAIWFEWMPPNGYNCRCYVDPVTTREYKGNSKVTKSFLFNGQRLPLTPDQHFGLKILKPKPRPPRVRKPPIVKPKPPPKFKPPPRPPKPVPKPKPKPPKPKVTPKPKPKPVAKPKPKVTAKGKPAPKKGTPEYWKAQFKQRQIEIRKLPGKKSKLPFRGLGAVEERLVEIRAEMASAKTITEVEQLLQEAFGISSVDLSGFRLPMAKRIGGELLRLQSRYPDIALQSIGMTSSKGTYAWHMRRYNTAGTGTNTLTRAGYGTRATRFEFNPKLLKDASCARDKATLWSPVDTIESTVSHEWGHAVHWQRMGFATTSAQSRAGAAINLEYFYEGRTSIKRLVSGYAGKNDHEFFAEMFSYMERIPSAKVRRYLDAEYIEKFMNSHKEFMPWGGSW